MGRARLVLILMVALVASLGLAFVAKGLATPRATKAVTVVQAAPVNPTVRILVARHELSVGDRIEASMLDWKPWPKDGLNPDYITDGAAPTAVSADAKGKAVQVANGALVAAKDVVQGADGDARAAFIGAVVREPVPAGEPITTAKVVKGGAGGVMAVTLNPGMRAMSVPLTADNSAGGFILPGDHVDVVLLRKSASGGAAHASTVMKNVRVLAVDQATHADPKAGPAKLGASATIELSPQQTEDIVLAKAQGDITLVLRAYADAAGATQVGDMTAGDSSVVKVFRNGEATEVKVER